MYMTIDRNGLVNRIFNALLIVSLFSITGYLLPPLISRTIPTSYYYDIKNPTPVDRVEYAPGDTVIISLYRYSRISQAAEQTLELSLVQTDAEHDINSERRYINIEPGDRLIRFAYKLPDNINTGTYIIRGNVHFKVENMSRNALLYTQEFIVATSSANLQ